MSVLVPCTQCSRHVRASESSCPFCQAELPAELAKRAVPAAGRRMDRLAMFTFAVGLTVAACGGVSGDSSDDQQQAQQQDDEAELKKRKDAGAKADAGCTEQEDPGAIIAMYGMPPFHMDAGSAPCATDAGHAKDAGKVKDSGSIHAMYGLPPEPIDEDAGSFHAMYGLPPHHN